LNVKKKKKNIGRSGIRSRDLEIFLKEGKCDDEWVDNR